MVWYIQYLWRVVEWVGHERISNEKHDKDCVEEGFQLAREKLDRAGEEKRYRGGVW